ncbi:MAG TPA: hypothetical protein VKQ08_11085, partial [Cyclobacteriaceae bacterium]|nr:hypothetical protein [Cyclobacteriaceae bacterium]
INLVTLAIVVTTLYGIVVFRRLPRSLKYFCWFLFLSGATEVASKILFIQKINNLPLLHLYVAGGFICLVLFYEAVLDGFIEKRIIRGIMMIFLVFTVANSIFFQPVTTFNSYALIAECIGVVIFALTTYFVMMDDVVKSKRQELMPSLNWINSGLFIYYSSSLIIFYCQSFLDSDRLFRFFPKHYTLQTWMLHAFFSLVMYSFFFAGLLKRPKY